MLLLLLLLLLLLSRFSRVRLCGAKSLIFVSHVVLASTKLLYSFLAADSRIEAANATVNTLE